LINDNATELSIAQYFEPQNNHHPLSPAQTGQYGERFRRGNLPGRRWRNSSNADKRGWSVDNRNVDNRRAEGIDWDFDEFGYLDPGQLAWSYDSRWYGDRHHDRRRTRRSGGRRNIKHWNERDVGEHKNGHKGSAGP
jgi:hypothetical protein